MPGLRVAINSGSWSNPTIWNGGAFPSVSDTVASNGFNVLIDQDVNVGSITNTAQSITSAITTMTSNTAPSGIVTVSSTNIGPGYQAFDNNSGTSWRSADYSPPDWISYEFTAPIAIDKFDMTSDQATFLPTDFTFDAWNGSAWINLLTVTGATGLSYTSPLLGNSTPYIKYRMYCTVRPSYYIKIVQLNMYEYLRTTSATAGGGFVLNNNINLTCTNGAAGISAGSSTCLLYSGSGASTINSSILGATTTGVITLVHSGSGVLTLNGPITGALATTNTAVTLQTPGTLNIVGSLFGPAVSTVNANALYIAHVSASVNIVGSILATGTQKQLVTLVNGNLNITGNIVVYSTSANSIVGLTTTGGNVQITGTVSMDNIAGGSDLVSTCVINGASCRMTITGPILGDTSLSSTRLSYSVINSGYLKHTGGLTAGRLYPTYISSAATAINILTGPFISSTYGIVPMTVQRMHYQKTTGSYYEFRNSETTGALAPGPTASAVRLYSPDSILSAPAAANVRYGVIFASGSFTGTLRMPSASQVAYGVPVDNTTGSAVITAGDVWNYLVANMTTTGSIGERIKNASTVSTTGQQLTSLNL
jgi:hypothetical protein